MSWKDLTEQQRQHARDVLTKRQLDVLTLHLAGCSQRRIATMLNLKRTTVRDHLTVAIACLKEDQAA